MKNNFIFNIIINKQVAIQAILITVFGIAYVTKSNKNIYYPSYDNKIRCINFSITQPIFEEIAFRGIILPITIPLLENNFYMLIILNGFLFMLFHLNYWSYKDGIQLFLEFFLVGMFFANIVIITNSIIYSVVCHILTNSCFTILGNQRKL